MKKAMVVLGLVAISSFAIFKIEHKPPHEVEIPDWSRIYANSLHGDLTWTKQGWNVDEWPYLNARNQIATLWRAKKLNHYRIGLYKDIALRNEEDSLALFRWTYACYCLASSHSDQSAGSGEVSEVLRVLKNRPIPTSYQFVRLRYLISQYDLPLGRILVPLGERLVVRDPKDNSVKRYHIRNLMTGDKENERKAIRYAREMVMRDRENINLQCQLGYVIQYTFIGRESKAKLKIGINAYRSSLSLNRSQGDWRKGIQHNIQEMESLLLKAKNA